MFGNAHFYLIAKKEMKTTQIRSNISDKSRQYVKIFLIIVSLLFVPQTNFRQSENNVYSRFVSLFLLLLPVSFISL